MRKSIVASLPILVTLILPANSASVQYKEVGSRTSGADVVGLTEGNMDGRVIASARPPGVVKDTGMCGSSLHGNREVSGLACGWMPASGRRGVVADDA